jgi:hypothetical protein
MSEPLPILQCTENGTGDSSDYCDKDDLGWRLNLNPQNNNKCQCVFLMMFLLKQANKLGRPQPILFVAPNDKNLYTSGILIYLSLFLTCSHALFISLLKNRCIGTSNPLIYYYFCNGYSINSFLIFFQ